MTTDDPARNRLRHGPRPIGALVPVVTRAAFRKRSPAAAQLMADWAQIVGPALAAVTMPRRFAQGALTLACTGPVALELQHLSGPLIERINAHLGQALVQRLRFVQAVGAATPPPLRPRRPPVAPVNIPGMAPGPLRDALAALGAAIEQDGSGDPA